MKNKIKKHNKKIFFAILLAGLFFGGFLTIKISNAFAIEDQQACTRSGGSWINNKCACPTGKSVLSATGDCGIQSQADANAIINGTPNDQGVDVILDSSDLNFSKTPATTQNTKKFNYTLLESFPGFFKAGSTLTDLPTMILAIYKFGIWTVGIAGLFMLVVGGFMYMASAGNTSTAGNARGIIWDALLGIVAALGAYLILYVINPELTKINLSFTPVAIKFDNIDASNPQGSTICQKECVSVADICKESPCSLHKPLAEKLRTALQGQNAWITEGWPVTVNHSSSCHGNGTCADVNLKTNKGDVQAVKKLYDAIVSAGLKPVYEDTAAGCVKYNAAGVYCRPYPTMTAPSFHVNNT